MKNLLRIAPLWRIIRHRATHEARVTLMASATVSSVVRTRRSTCRTIGSLSSLHRGTNTRTLATMAATSDILSLPVHFLRASDACNFDPSTFQRNDVLYDGHTGKPATTTTTSSTTQTDTPQIMACKELDASFEITWQDGTVSRYSRDWVQQQVKLWKTSNVDRVHWTGLTDTQVRQSSELSLTYPDILTEQGMKNALKSLYRYGILLIRETPIHDHGVGIAALGAALGGGAVKNQLSVYNSYQQGKHDLVLPHGTDGPLRTLYGTVWATSSASQAEGSSRADSAYGTDGLPLHTDMTYHRDPPGLQIFTMIQPASQGGESIFGDGFAAAERLRAQHPDAFALLSSTSRRYQCRDADTGWHLQATGPVIQTDAAGCVTAIRHNDLDRLPDLPSPLLEASRIPDYYAQLADAHRAWDSILAQDDIRLVMPLQAGETMVVANQRCFHGRFGFQIQPNEAPRAVMGCYVSQDELNSRFRMEGYLVA